MTAVQIEITSTDYLDPDFCWYEFFGSEVDHPLGDVEANAEFFDVAFATIFLHAGLEPGETWYHWARAVYDNGTRKSSIAALGPVLIDGIITAQLNDAAVTYAKIQNVSATDRLLGRSSAGAGPIEEIVATAFARSLLDDADAAAARATLGAIGALNPVFTEDITVGGTDANSVVRFYDANVYIGRASSALEMFGSFGVVITSGVGGDINLNPGAGREAYLSGDLIATEPFVAAAIAALIDSSPGALDTLNELAAALGDDPAFATTVANALGNRLRFDAAQSLSGGEKTQAQTNAGVLIGTDVQAYDADLAALAALGTAGMIARTGAGTVAARTLAGTASEITVTNGDGVAGAPTWSLPAALDFSGKTITPITGSGTVTLKFGGASVGITYSVNVIRWTQYGNRLFFSLRFILTSKGTSVGVATIALPFTSANVANAAHTITAIAEGFGAGVNSVVGQIAPNASIISIFSFAAGALADITNAEFGNGSFLNISGVIEV